MLLYVISLFRMQIIETIYVIAQTKKQIALFTVNPLSSSGTSSTLVFLFAKFWPPVSNIVI